MATRRTASQPVPAPELTVTHEEARTRLNERIVKGKELCNRPISTEAALTLNELRADFTRWDDFNTEMLRRIFTTPELAKDYGAYAGLMYVGMYERPLHTEIQDKVDEVRSKIQQLESIVERLELIPVASNVLAVATLAPRAAPKPIPSKRVFVVHGRDEMAKTNLEVLLHRWGLEPVVLHREPDGGMTIIEKFEKYSDVGYAFILLTPDEIAYLAAEDQKPDSERAKEFRARPNVIFEFGYFVGRLGRSRVCCLYTGNVTVPSDLSGIVYKPYTHKVEEVAYGIMQDLAAAGYRLSMG